MFFLHQTIKRKYEKNTLLKIVTIVPSVILIILILVGSSLGVRIFLELFWGHVTVDDLIEPRAYCSIFMALVTVPVLFWYYIKNKKENDKVYKKQLILMWLFGIISFSLIVFGLPFGSGFIIVIPLFFVLVIILFIIAFLSCTISNKKKI